MGLFFKRKKPKTSEEITGSVKKLAVFDKPKTKTGFGLFGVLQKAHVTEKTSLAASENKYVFAVSKDANKHQIKQAVEGRYGVGVKSVNIINLPGKERRRGNIIGWKPGMKKAIVKVKEGEKIEIQ